MIRIATPFKLIVILFTAALTLVMHQAFSYKSGPPTGSTGAPGESNCTSCHSGTAVSNSSNVLVYSNMTNGQYIPDSTYQIILRAVKSGCVRWGFETTMLNTNASPGKLGLLQVPTGATAIQLNSGTRDYISQTNSGSSSLYTDSTDWIFNWKAPSTLSGDAKLYIAVNASNNNGNDQGDQIHLKNFTFPQTTNVPVASFTTNVNSICQGDSIFFQGSGTNGGSSYQWTFPGGTPGSSAAQSLWVKFSGTGNKICSLRVANSIMNSSYTTKTITVLANPTTNISYNSSLVLCDGDSISITTTFNINYSYQWQKNGSNITGANGAQYYAKSTGGYRVIVTNNNGCSVTTSTATVTFNARPLAVITAPAGTTACQGDTIHLLANSGSNYSYYWYKDNILISQSLDSNLYVTQNGIYYVKTFTAVGGCQASSNPLTITFFNKPSAFITAQADSICNGDSVMLNTNTPDTIAFYQWKKNGIIITGANRADYFVTNTGYYTVDLITNRGCSASASAKYILVNPFPAPNFIDSLKNGCTYLLRIRNNPVYAFEWLNNGSIINTTDTLLTVSQTGNYSLRVKNSSGCGILTNSIFLNVPNAPNVNITPVNNAVICSDSNITYTVPFAASTSYKWYKNGSLISGATQNSLTISDSGNYAVSVDNGSCVVSSSVRNVKVNSVPSALLSFTDSSFCTGDSVQLSTTNLPGQVYLWYKNNIAITNSTNSNYFAVTAGAYKVKVSLGSCSKISNAVNIIEKTLPVVVITRNVNQLSATSGSAYQWFKNGLAISGAILQNYTVTGNGTYTVQVTAVNGCRNTSAGIFVIPTGINSGETTNIASAFPNPVYDHLNLSFADYGVHDIEITDAQGRTLKIMQSEAISARIDFSGVEAGIYFIKIYSMAGSQVIRIVKK